MAKKLSLLKPNVHMTTLNNEVKERVDYLQIPSCVGKQALKNDVMLGATQFCELDSTRTNVRCIKMNGEFGKSRAQ